jgi:hypothetical protein
MNESETLRREEDHREEEIRGLLVSALDGHASDAELQQLNEALRGDESLRRSTQRFLMDDALLAEEIGTLDEAIHILRHSAESLSAEPNLATRAKPTRQSPSFGSAHGAGLLTLAQNSAQATLKFINHHGLAVAVMAMFVLAGIAWNHVRLMTEFDRLYSLTTVPDPSEHNRIRKDSQQAAMMPGATSVARATAVVNCEWFDGETELKFGDQLSPGQRVKLKRGLLQLTFGTGAKVVVEGPADFVATTATEAVLSAGKIAAAVPKFARGYTILTPTAEIVDLGTEFGVNVDGQGASEVHVFDGDVVARPRENGIAQGELLHAQQDEALQFNGANDGGQRISVDRTKFVRRLTPDRSPDELRRCACLHVARYPRRRQPVPRRRLAIQ